VHRGATTGNTGTGVGVACGGCALIRTPSRMSEPQMRTKARRCNLANSQTSWTIAKTQEPKAMLVQAAVSVGPGGVTIAALEALEPRRQSHNATPIPRKNMAGGHTLITLYELLL
jgi:hypothetical protein